MTIWPELFLLNVVPNWYLETLLLHKLMSFLRSALLFICWMTPLFDVRKLPARIDMWICSPLRIDHRENVTIIGVKWVSFKKVISHQFAGGSDLESMVFYRWTKWIINHRNYPQFIYFHLHKVLPAAPRAWSPWFHVFFIPRPAEFIKNTSSICLCLNPSLAKFNKIFQHHGAHGIVIHSDCYVSKDILTIHDKPPISYCWFYQILSQYIMVH